MKESRPFRFKRFEVSHSRSSMKVGVDGVMLGCRAGVEHARRILDVGTGCGVVALICAQRAPQAEVVGIDIDEASVEEAAANFSASPFAERMACQLADFNEFESDALFDCIVSNPPYFDSGVREASTARMGARHQLSLTVRALLGNASRLLAPGGRLWVVLPSEQLEALASAALAERMHLSRLELVRGHAGAPVKRMLAELMNDDAREPDSLPLPDPAMTAADYAAMLREAAPVRTMLEPNGRPTDWYRRLGHDFYLHY